MNHLIASSFFLLWSFILNYLGTILLYNTLWICPQCKKKISREIWSIFSSGRCSCGQTIIYKPLTFLLLGYTIFSCVYKLYPDYFAVSFAFTSLLFINIRTDAETSLLSRFTTLYPVPFFLAAAYLNLTQISFIESLVGIILGYGFLLFVRWLFFRMTKQEGLGLGDVELAALIGSFLGPLGVWFSIIVGSITGIMFILIQRTVTQKNIQRIPFAPFLCIAALIFFILKLDNLIMYLL